VIINKVLGTKVDYITDFARRGFKRKGLELLGVIPHQQILSSPTVDLIREELQAEVLTPAGGLNGLVEDVVVGAMGAANAMTYFKRGVLLITPGDREDIILTACASLESNPGQRLAGIVLTGNLRPNASLMKVVQALPIPVLFTLADSYRVASKVHDLTVKTRPSDSDKISLIRDLIAEKVDLNRILDAIN
jgi:BioD-like phosphotransacetylase family protein